MKRLIPTFAHLFILITLAVCTSCSKQSPPGLESALVGKWQGIEKLGMEATFLKDGTFSVTAFAVGWHILGGKYQLIDGGRIVMTFDALSLKGNRATNKVSIVGQELRITTADGKTERYKRVE